MNARYILEEDPAALSEHFGIQIRHNFPARYNIAPSQPVPIIRQGQDGRACDLVRWGFVPAWDKKGDFFKKAIVNIRSESASVKNSFKHAWRRRHCLFPMNAFYEWIEEGGEKQPYALALSEERPLFCLAGLWEYWMGEDGSEMETAAFLTRDGFYPLTTGTDRMPVFCPPEMYTDWLEADETDEGPGRALLALPQPELIFWPVSKRVNSWKPDDAGLIERQPPPPTQASLL